MTSGGLVGADGAELGNRDLKLGQQLEQEALELLVGAIDLVDQQHRRARALRIDRLQQRTLDQEGFAVEFAVVRAARSTVAGGVENAQLQQLPRVVPFVERVADVEAFVALQANQIGARARPRRALASAVLPTPASPSRNSGRCSRSARNSETARPRSAT